MISTQRIRPRGSASDLLSEQRSRSSIIVPTLHTLFDMMPEQWEVLFYADAADNEPVREWLDELETNSPAHHGRVRHHIDLLEEFGPLLAEPYSRQLKGKLRELRPGPWRVTYFADPHRRMILLTSFRKTTRATPRPEIQRAEKLMQDWLDRMGEHT